MVHNGVRQTDQTASSFSYTFDEVGAHTVSLLVLDGGALGGYGESVLVPVQGRPLSTAFPLSLLKAARSRWAPPVVGIPRNARSTVVTMDSF
jgi:hypothetical protein